MKFFIYFIVSILLGMTFGHLCYGEEYNREKHFGGWKDIGGINTREYVLIKDSIVGVEIKDGKIVWGIWICPYTGLMFDNPSKLDVDHVVPLKEVFVSGGDKWDNRKRSKYANYIFYKKHLIAVQASANREKGAKDIVEWLPMINIEEYVANWYKIKENWELCYDQKEQEILRNFGHYSDNICKY